MSAAPKPRQPWPMKWVVLAILAMLVPYTIITLRYRKAGPAFEPYEDLKNRANVSRLLSAGYQRIPIAAQRPADGPRTRGGASVLPSPGGLPADLRTTLVEAPLLPVDIVSVTAPPTARAQDPYSLQFTCTLPDDKQQLGGAEIYLRGDSIVITPTFDHVAGELQTRSRQPSVLLTIPAGALKPGRYQVNLVGQRASRAWPLEVQ